MALDVGVTVRDGFAAGFVDGFVAGFEVAGAAGGADSGSSAPQPLTARRAASVTASRVVRGARVTLFIVGTPGVPEPLRHGTR
ncbi:hypothetical protein GCM10023146_31280 [Nocardioides caricicola]